MRESGGRGCFAEKSLACCFAGEVGGEDFDGDVAIEMDVAREIDDPHSAAAELALERILTGEGRLQLEEFAGGLRHVGTAIDGEDLLQNQDRVQERSTLHNKVD